MSDGTKFFYPIKNSTQLTFDGRSIFVPLYQEGHLDQGGYLLCGANKQELKDGYSTKNDTLRTILISGVPICKKCQEVYKAANGMWLKWVSPTSTPSESQNSSTKEVQNA
jgi:hypothetical protein